MAVGGPETSLDGHTGTIDRHPGDEAASDFVIHPQDESLILTFPQVRVGAVGLQDRRASLRPALVPFPQLDLHLVDASPAGTDTGINVAARRVALFLQTENREDAVQTTVIELDPFPAVIHRAHVLPEETEGDEDLSLPAVHPVRLLPETGAEGKTDPAPGQGLGREGWMRRAADGGDPHLVPQELTRKNQPLILPRPASPVMIAV